MKTNFSEEETKALCNI